MDLPPVAMLVMRLSCLKPPARARLQSDPAHPVVHIDRGDDTMADRPFNQADLDVLAQWDTPTICNGLEITNPERRRFGYTVEPMVCINPKAKPIVGLARVGMIRSTEVPPIGR